MRSAPLPDFHGPMADMHTETNKSIHRNNGPTLREKHGESLAVLARITALLGEIRERAGTLGLCIDLHLPVVAPTEDGGGAMDIHLWEHGLTSATVHLLRRLMDLNPDTNRLAEVLTERGIPDDYYAWMGLTKRLQEMPDIPEQSLYESIRDAAWRTASSAWRYLQNLPPLPPSERDQAQQQIQEMLMDVQSFGNELFRRPDPLVTMATTRYWSSMRVVLGELEAEVMALAGYLENDRRKTESIIQKFVQRITAFSESIAALRPKKDPKDENVYRAEFWKIAGERVELYALAIIDFLHSALEWTRDSQWDIIRSCARDARTPEELEQFMQKRMDEWWEASAQQSNELVTTLTKFLAVFPQDARQRLVTRVTKAAQTPPPQIPTVQEGTLALDDDAPETKTASMLRLLSDAVSRLGTS